MTDDLKGRLEREAELAPMARADVDSVLRGGRKRRRTRIAATAGAGLLTVLAIAVGASALDGPRPSPEQPPVQSPDPSPTEQSCAGGPKVRPSRPSGKVGDHIDLGGTCLKGHGLKDVYLRATVRYGPNFAPRNGAVCDLVAKAGSQADVQDGTLQGLFIVPEQGICFGGQYMQKVPVREGKYDIAIGCRECFVAKFRVLPPPTPESIALPPLPSEGFVVQEAEGVLFVGSDGQVYERLEGFELRSSVEQQAPLLQGPRQTYYEVDVGGSVVEQIDEAAFEERLTSHLVATAGLPEPSGARGSVTRGVMWFYDFERSDGAILAQWGGECETGTAFWAEGGGPQIITGEASLRESPPESTALGWSSSGDAYVALDTGACGGRGDPPGIYAFSAPGEGRLIYRTAPGTQVDIWP